MHINHTQLVNRQASFEASVKANHNFLMEQIEDMINRNQRDPSFISDDAAHTEQAMYATIGLPRMHESMFRGHVTMYALIAVYVTAAV